MLDYLFDVVERYAITGLEINAALACFETRVLGLEPCSMMCAAGL